MNPLRWLSVALVVILPLSPSRPRAGTGLCTVTPSVVPMETEYTISATGRRPNATHGITIRQSGKGSYTKGIGSHPNAGLDTDAEGSGSTMLVAHGSTPTPTPAWSSIPTPALCKCTSSSADGAPHSGETARGCRPA